MKKHLTKILMLLGVFVLLGAGNASAWFWTFNGVDDGWDNSSNRKEYNSATPGTLTYQLDRLTGDFLFIKTGDRDVDWIKDPKLITSITPSSVKAENSSEGNIRLSSTLYDVTITVSFDAYGNNITDIKISGSIYPSTAYLMGDINGFKFAPNKGVPANGNGVYTWENIEVNESKDGYGFFNISSYLNANSNEWDGFNNVNWSDRFGSEKSDANNGDIILDPGDVLDVEVYRGGNEAQGTQSWQILPGTYNITLDLTKMKISASRKLTLGWNGDGMQSSGNSFTFNGTHGSNSIVTLSTDVEGTTQHVDLLSVSCPKHSSKQVRGAAPYVPGCFNYDNGSLTFNHAGTYEVTAQVSDDANGYHSEPITLTATIDPEEFYLYTDEIGLKNPSYKFVYNEEDASYTLDVALVDYTEVFSIKNADGSLNYTNGENDLQNNNSVDLDNNLEENGMSLETSLMDVTFTLQDVNASTANLTINGTATTGNNWLLNLGNDKTMQSGTVNGKNIVIATVGTGALVYVYPPTPAVTAYYKVTPTTDGVATQAEEGYKELKKNSQGEYTISLQLGKGTIDLYYDTDTQSNLLSTTFNYTVDKSVPTGVEAIGAVEEGEAVYYNLQGVRVENPERGIFVKVVNGKATKVVL